MCQKVSIITVCYNGERTITRTIESVLNQTYKNIEYIIVDGKSTDGTIEIIKSFEQIFSETEGKILHYISEPDRGIYDAMNKGILMSSGQFIGIINSDDWYESATVEKVVSNFCQNQADVVYGNLRIVERNNEARIIYPEKKEGCWWYTMGASHPTCFVKKEVYDEIGLYDDNYKITADYDFLLRCFIGGKRFDYINDILANFTVGGISTTKIKECALEHIRVSLKYIDIAPEPQKVCNELMSKMTDMALIEFPEALKEIDLVTPISIWGAGKVGNRIKGYFDDFDFPIAYWVDSQYGKIGGGVTSPDVLRTYRGTIIIAVKKSEEIANIILDYKNNNIIIKNMNDLGLPCLIKLCERDYEVRRVYEILCEMKRTYI